MTSELQSIRARCAYWEKRIELAKGRTKKEQLAQFAWAEIGRMCLTSGVRAYGRSAGKFATAMDTALRVALK